MRKFVQRDLYLEQKAKIEAEMLQNFEKIKKAERKMNAFGKKNKMELREPLTNRYWNREYEIELMTATYGQDFVDTIRVRNLFMDLYDPYYEGVLWGFFVITDYSISIRIFLIA